MEDKFLLLSSNVIVLFYIDLQISVPGNALLGFTLIYPFVIKLLINNKKPAYAGEINFNPRAFQLIYLYELNQAIPKFENSNEYRFLLNY